jgi:serine protease Do
VKSLKTSQQCNQLLVLFKTINVACMAVLFVPVANAQKNYKLPDSSERVLTTQETEDVKAFKNFSKVFVNIARETRPSLVFIETKTQAPQAQTQQRRGAPFGPEDFFGPFFGQPRQQGPRQGAGSGFIVDLKQGYILTNNHVAGDATEISVTTFDNRKFKGKVVGADKSVDVAVVKLENFSAGGLKSARLADSDATEVGDWVVALGAPFGLPQTLTVGVVSALGRGNIMGGDTLEDFIQTDAAINPGNSGGPLLNLDGKVVGINTAISSPSGSSAGIGFAVPSNMARTVSEMLINDGKVTRGYLGLRGRDFQDLTPEVIKNMGLPENTEGAFVLSVDGGSPADKAGVKPSDVIQNINGIKISNFSQMRNRIAFIKPGTTVKVQLLRDGKPKDVNLTIGSLNAEKEQVKSSSAQVETNDFGFSVSELTNELRSQFSVVSKTGLLVRDVAENSPSQAAGLRRGDVVLEVNRRTIKTASELNKALKAAQDKRSEVLITIERDGRNQLLVLPLQQ